jgi:hypothetical protein
MYCFSGLNLQKQNERMVAAVDVVSGLNLQKQKS